MPKRKSTLRKDMLREAAAAYGGPGGEVVLYQTPEGKVTLEVRLEQDTIWLTQKQMSLLFETERSVITKHLRNIFQSGELDEDSVCAIFAHTASDGKTYQTQYYNLDAVISVGYRVNSKRGTQFRIWATQVLRDHILKGYTVNTRRLAELKQTVKLVAAMTDRRQLTNDEATALLRVLEEYALALDVLDDYDHGRIPVPKKSRQKAVPLDADEARRVIAAMREHFGASALFGREKDGGLESASVQRCFCAFWKKTAPSIWPMERSDFRTRRWLRSRCSSPKVHRRIKTPSFALPPIFFRTDRAKPWRKSHEAHRHQRSRS
jgi:hypothetical protein